MSGRERWWRAPPGEDARALARALAAELELAPSPAVRLERTYLDTYDRRLHERGEVLVHERAAGGAGVLVLRSRESDGGELRVPADGLPRGVDDLTEALRARIGKAISPRALLPAGSEKVTARVLRRLDGNGKTVARVEVERASAGRGAAVVRTRLRSVRGYPAPAQKLDRALAARAGLEDDGDAADWAATAAGLPAGPPPSALDLELDRQDPAPASMSRLLLALLDEVEATERGTLERLDIEFLHEYRVAVRRSRSAVRLARPVLPPRFEARWAPELRWLGGVTGPPRDLDVFDVAEYRGWLPEDAAPGLADLADAVRERRETAYEELRTALRSRRYRTLKTGWRRALHKLAAAPGPPTGELARDAIERSHRRVVRDGSKIDADSPAEALHDLRKDAKRLRYALELFGSLLPQDDLKRQVKELKRLQDNLGAFQDYEVHRHFLTGIAEELAATRPHAVMAAALLGARFEDRQHAARDEFAERFERFASKQNTRRFEKLAEAARP